MARKIKTIFKLFSLIELIIVIGIIAILSTAGYLVLSKYASKSRDAARISEANTIKKRLEIFYVKKMYYPDPGKMITISSKEYLIAYQGLFDESVLSDSVFISKLSKDPTDKKYYSFTKIISLGIGGEIIVLLENKTLFSKFVGNKAFAESLIGGRIAKYVPYGNVKYQNGTEYVLPKPIAVIDINQGVLNEEHLGNNGEIEYDLSDLSTSNDGKAPIVNLIGDDVNSGITLSTLSQIYDGELVESNSNTFNDGSCGTANGEIRVSKPVQGVDSCSKGDYLTGIDTATHYNRSCLGIDGGSNATCSSIIFISPIEGTHTPSSDSITWSWNNGGQNHSKYEWSNNGIDWIDLGINTNYKETGLNESTLYSNRKVRAYDGKGDYDELILGSISTTNSPVNGVCGTANGQSRVAQPLSSGERCTVGTFQDVADNADNFLWQCSGENGGSSQNCNSIIIKSPIEGTHSQQENSITWNWSNGGGNVFKYQWSADGVNWIDKGTQLTHNETGLICEQLYSNRKLRSCDDKGDCTNSTTLTSQTTSNCTLPATGGLGVSISYNIASTNKSVIYNNINNRIGTTISNYPGGTAIIAGTTVNGSVLVSANNNENTSSSGVEWYWWDKIKKANSYSDGKYNTSKIYSTPQSRLRASRICYIKGGTSNIWYLPARDELNVMMNNRNKIGRTIDGLYGPSYWSSTESVSFYSNYYAWDGTLDLHTNTIKMGQNNPKGYKKQVRCASRF